MHDLFVRCVYGEIVNIVAAVREPPDLSLNVTEDRLADDDTLETAIDQHTCHIRSFRGLRTRSRAPARCALGPTASSAASTPGLTGRLTRHFDSEHAASTDLSIQRG